MFNIRCLIGSTVFFASFILFNAVNGQSLISNYGFEDDSTAPFDKPDFYRYRSVDYHHVETNSANVYQGSKCGLFNNTTSSNVGAYYYSCYSADGTTANYLDTTTGCEYELSVKFKTDASFTGSGISIQLIFVEDDVYLGDAVSVPRTSTSWDTIRIRGKVKGRVNKVLAAIYYKGIGKAWVDNLELVKISTPLLKNGSFEVESPVTSGLPDNFLVRSTTSAYHFLETSLTNTYLGNQAALFDSPTTNTCYYYGPYNTVTSSSEYIPVCPGDSYKITGFNRVDSSFIGSGMKLSLIYWNGNTYVDRDDSSYSTSDSWVQVSTEGIVPAGVNFLSGSVEYKGENEGWFDEVEINKLNLATNSCFETDSTAPTGIPDYWLARSTTLAYHSIETNSTLTYEGNACALFNNTTPTSATCYYYGPTETASATLQPLNVKEGEEYTLTCYGKVDSNFSGNGISVSVLYWNDGVFVSRSDSSSQTPSTWTQLSITSTVPSGVGQMTYAIEYRGSNKAWMDKVEIEKTDDPWYYTPASLDSFEALSFTPPTKPSLTTIQNEFVDHHDEYELVYNDDGSWDVGYGTAPLVRASANAVIAYLGAYNKFTDATLKATFETRAEEALEWLLTEQLTSGAFPYYSTSTPETTGGGVMYESGLAGAALIAGYNYFNDSRYLDASNDVCDYLVTIDSSSNANFNSFATWALVENYQVTGTQAYLDKALFFLDCMQTFQLDSGMWADQHNQYIYYQGINVRGIALAIDALAATHPKRDVLMHALYRGINHIRRSMASNGTVITHPIYEGTIYNSQCVATISIAYDRLGMTGLDDALKTLSVGAQYLPVDTVQGFSLAGLGILLNSYY